MTAFTMAIQKVLKTHKAKGILSFVKSKTKLSKLMSEGSSDPVDKAPVLLSELEITTIMGKIEKQISNQANTWRHRFEAVRECLFFSNAVDITFPPIPENVSSSTLKVHPRLQT